MSNTRFVLNLSPENPNTRENIEPTFVPNGSWEAKHGRKFTGTAAERFHRAITVPTDIHTVLDLGCGLGDATPIWHSHYPNIELFGCDVANSAVGRCQERYGHIAKFFKAGFEDVNDQYDAIYCSHVLEHFEQHVEIAAHLLRYCRILYVLTPFNELQEKRPWRPSDSNWHVATLWSDSFDTLVHSGAAETIETKILLWPTPLYRRAARIVVRGAQHILLGTPQYQENLQIAFTISSLIHGQRN